MVLERSCNQTAYMQTIFFKTRDRHGHTPFHMAASVGNAKLAKTLIQAPPEVERAQHVGVVDPQGYTAQDLARIAYFEDIVDMIYCLSSSSQPEAALRSIPYKHTQVASDLQIAEPKGQRGFMWSA